MVIVPLSTVSTQTLSRVSANLVKEGKAEGESGSLLGLGRGFPQPLLPKRARGCSYLTSGGLLSSLPRCCRPLVQAKMLAMGLVLVGRP